MNKNLPRCKGCGKEFVRLLCKPGDEGSQPAIRRFRRVVLRRKRDFGGSCETSLQSPSLFFGNLSAASITIGLTAAFVFCTVIFSKLQLLFRDLRHRF